MLAQCEYPAFLCILLKGVVPGQGIFSGFSGVLRNLREIPRKQPPVALEGKGSQFALDPL